MGDDVDYQEIATELWRDYQADLLRPTGVDDPHDVAEAIHLGDLVLLPAPDLAERTADRDRLASLLDRARPYLDHDPTCVAVWGVHYTPCDCGLADLIAEVWPDD